MVLQLKRLAWKVLRPKGFYNFIDSVDVGSKLLDVGCGNNSPYIVKSLRPDIYYVGIDVGVYNQTSDYSKFANEIIITEPATFSETIAQNKEKFDAIISRHNLEHCNDYVQVLLAMLGALKKGGTIYCAFPCEESVNFPSRAGSLNFYDDKTHKAPIPYSSVLTLLKDNSMQIQYATKRYRPLILFVVGALLEPLCRITKKQAILGGTWALYGFESIIIARKN